MSSTSNEHSDEFGCTKGVVEYIKKNAQRGDPMSVLETSDEYYSKFAHESMHIGPLKGSIVDKILVESKPTIALELGTYWGYTAVRFANLMAPGSKYFSVEYNSDVLQFAKEVVEFAGLADRVVLIEGSSELIIPKMKKDYQVEAFDFVFIDHDKTLYKSDIIKLEENRLLKEGSIIVADNVIFPDVANYVDYVRNSPRFSSTMFDVTIPCYNGTHIKDGIEKSIYSFST